MESHKRTLAKSLTWRVTAFSITTTIAWAVTDRPEIAASIGLADTLIKLATYYIHERAWLKVDFGKLKMSQTQVLNTIPPVLSTRLEAER